MNKQAVISLLLGTSAAQQVGHQKSEYHPPLPLGQCTKSGGCQSQQRSITLDANWRWTHETGNATNCYDGDHWNTNDCPDNKTCAQKCALDGADQQTWGDTYGASTSGNALKLGFVTQGPYSKNVGSRTYMMESDEKYEMFKLLNQEFTFDVDVSNMPCGLNGALYFVEMEPDGGLSKHPGNKAGAKYGTGYCDAQCPHDIKFIYGEANAEGWTPSATDPNAGAGKYGSCCAEMDIWEANKMSEAFTSHPCMNPGHYRCEGKECGDTEKGHRYDGVCDKDGCDLNPFRAGVKDFFGEGKTIDTTKKFTVVTQFHTTDGTANGDLKEIRRIFVQDGKVYQHPMSKIDTMSTQYDSITDEMCGDMKKAFGDQNDHEKKGGLKKMGEAMGREGMVLVMSIWDDHADQMLWLDSNDPKDKTTWGGPRGTCPTTSGVPSDVENNHPDAHVIFSDVRIGEFDSTYKGSKPGPTPPGPGPTPSGCPGGSLSACIGLCPSNPPIVFKDCVESCTKRCDPGKEEEAFNGPEYLEDILDSKWLQ